jgi:hypothetical protein
MYMNQLQKRTILFLFGCIFVRSIFVLIAKNIDSNKLPWLGGLSLIPAIGFTIIYLFDLRKTGGETFGKKIWWNHLRPIHAFLYFSFAWLAFNKNAYSYIPLLVDVVVGFMSFIHKHSSNMRVIFS